MKGFKNSNIILLFHIRTARGCSDSLRLHVVGGRGGPTRSSDRAGEVAMIVASIVQEHDSDSRRIEHE